MRQTEPAVPASPARAQSPPPPPPPPSPPPLDPAVKAERAARRAAQRALKQGGAAVRQQAAAVTAPAAQPQQQAAAAAPPQPPPTQANAAPQAAAVGATAAQDQPAATAAAATAPLSAIPQQSLYTATVLVPGVAVVGKRRPLTPDSPTHSSTSQCDNDNNGPQRCKRTRAAALSPQAKSAPDTKSTAPPAAAAAASAAAAAGTAAAGTAQSGQPGSQDTASSATEPSLHVYLVLDTNVLIDGWQVLTPLRQQFAPHTSQYLGYGAGGWGGYQQQGWGGGVQQQGSGTARKSDVCVSCVVPRVAYKELDSIKKYQGTW